MSREMRRHLAMCAVLAALAGCQSAALRQMPPLASSAVAERNAKSCEERVNDSLAKVEECIVRGSLWRHLEHFQLIADENPGPKGHGNRDTGTPGYRASVKYVADLMRHAGYAVTIQRYNYRKFERTGIPRFDAAGGPLVFERDWFVARLSGPGRVAAPVEPPRGSPDGCSLADFAGFGRSNVALVERGRCDADVQVANAQAAGAGAVILYEKDLMRPAHEARLIDATTIPVIGVVTNHVGAELLRRYRDGRKPVAQIAVDGRFGSDVDYNVIADSPFGDPRHIVVIDAHLDAIYGAGMLDNASGSTTTLEIALSMAKTHTHNRLRYIWFGGEEIGLLGSRYYTTHLKKAQLHDIVFDIDADVTATPNFDILIADPKFAQKVKHFPSNVVPESKIGNDYFYDYFRNAGIISRPAWFGNNGTDSLSFSLAGTPNSGILTQQDCCKHSWETRLWGGFRGDYEGKMPGFNGGCVDRPRRWCDNLYNNDPFVLEFVSRAVAYVAFKLANRHFSW